MATATLPKTYLYKSYKNSVFKGILTNVISDFEYQQEINSAGSTVTIILGVAADNYGEGTLVDFNNNIQIYEIDDENPAGTMIFQGLIVNYKPIFTDTNQEQVILTVMGYGSTFNDYIIEAGSSVDTNQNGSAGGSSLGAVGSSAKSGDLTDVIQSFTTGASVTKLSYIQFKLAAHALDDIGNSAFLQLFTSQADAQGAGTSSVIATASVVLTSQTAGVYSFVFASPVTVVAATKYWARISYSASDHTTGGIGNPGYSGQVDVYYDNTAPLAGQTLETVYFNGASWQAPVTTSGSAYIITYTATGNTQSPYTSQDPSAILKSIIDNYNAQGGLITYTPSSIDLTNTSVSYTFNSNTVYEGIQKCLSMAPVGWYWYVDQVNNVLHFHKIASTPSHNLTFGKNIKNLAVEKRAQDLVNIVYFVGGPTAGVNLFQKYTQQTSIDLYGRHALRYTDNNVTLAATAQTIANSILTNRGQVELRIDLDILDNGGLASSALGFNIESIVLGEMISFRSLGPGTGGSLWDVAKWDVAKWDFDITDLSSVVVQVTKVDYKPDILHLSLSTVPPDVTKRVEDIYRNLQQVSNLSNPVAPS